MTTPTCCCSDKGSNAQGALRQKDYTAFRFRGKGKTRRSQSIFRPLVLAVGLLVVLLAGSAFNRIGGPGAAAPGAFPEGSSLPAVMGALQPGLRRCSPLAGESLDTLTQVIADPYHPPPPGREERHHGIDFAYYRRAGRVSIQGLDVQSVLTGTVAAALSGTFPYGNAVIVESALDLLPTAWVDRLGARPGDVLYVLYAHLESAPLLRMGEHVSLCQVVGQVGKTGNAGMAHLHLETRLGPAGSRFPGMRYYVKEATPEEKQAYRLWRTSGVFRHFNPLDLLSPGDAPPPFPTPGPIHPTSPSSSLEPRTND